MILAIAVFKPFGLEVGQWQAYLHLLSLFVLGLFSCFITEVILRYALRMPRSYERGIDYIISRNLRFQLINTPLVALFICLYRHFVMSSLVESNHLSASNYIETLAIIAFLSFAIGLYWRFKFRSKYLEMELEEIRELNEQLKSLTAVPVPADVTTRDLSPVEGSACAQDGENDGEQAAKQAAPLSTGREAGGEIVLRGTTNESVTLHVTNLLYIEAVGNYVKVSHLREKPRAGELLPGMDVPAGIGQVHTDMLRSTMKQMEEMLKDAPMIVRCHRAFLVNLGQVEQIVSRSGSTQLLIKHCHESLPVSRSNMAQVKAAIHKNTVMHNEE